jgi:hypothetical protein
MWRTDERTSLDVCLCKFYLPSIKHVFHWLQYSHISITQRNGFNRIAIRQQDHNITEVISYYSFYSKTSLIFRSWIHVFEKISWFCKWSRTYSPLTVFIQRNDKAKFHLQIEWILQTLSCQSMKPNISTIKGISKLDQPSIVIFLGIIQFIQYELLRDHRLIFLN